MSYTALYPGSFDPITYGHLDILERATHMFDKVVVTVAVNREKKYVFSPDQRVHLIEECLKDKPWREKVEIDQFSGLLAEYARSKKINTLIRGVRQVSDFEYEFRMALMNRRLNNNIDTIFLMPDEELTFVSATLVREVAFWGGDMHHFVPDNVAKALTEHFKKIKNK